MTNQKPSNPPPPTFDPFDFGPSDTKTTNKNNGFDDFSNFGNFGAPPQQSQPTWDNGFNNIAPEKKETKKEAPIPKKEPIKVEKPVEKQEKSGGWFGKSTNKEKKDKKPTQPPTPTEQKVQESESYPHQRNLIFFSIQLLNF